MISSCFRTSFFTLGLSSSSTTRMPAFLLNRASISSFGRMGTLSGTLSHTVVPGCSFSPLSSRVHWRDFIGCSGVTGGFVGWTAGAFIPLPAAGPGAPGPLPPGGPGGPLPPLPAGGGGPFPAGAAGPAPEGGGGGGPLPLPFAGAAGVAAGVSGALPPGPGGGGPLPLPLPFAGAAGASSTSSPCSVGLSVPAEALGRRPRIWEAL
mmetsp:Transcript_2616/g.6115  ORF Transcript_2616/g.6115 Transcript_2616/m.6115 type:complete len:207 (-) Transcript_2616:1885-2505(-)